MAWHYYQNAEAVSLVERLRNNFSRDSLSAQESIPTVSDEGYKKDYHANSTLIKWIQTENATTIINETLL